MNCIYIHGKRIVDDIMNDLKTMETRNSNTLDRFVGQRVGIILTGCGKPKLMGTVMIVDKFKLRQGEFDTFYYAHRIKPDSRYHVGNQPYKWAYELYDPKPFETPIELKPVKGNRIWREV